MSYAMFCATHGPQMKAPCPECGSWHTDPRPETPAEHDKLRKAIDAVRDTEPDYKHARELMERLGIAASIADAGITKDCEGCGGTGRMAINANRMPRGFMAFVGGGLRDEDGVQRIVCPLCRPAPDTSGASTATHDHRRSRRSWNWPSANTVVRLREEFRLYAKQEPDAMRRAPLLMQAEFRVVDRAFALLEIATTDTGGWAFASAAERDIHGLCPGHPIGDGEAATCSVCNLSRVMLNRLVAWAVLDRFGQEPEPQPSEGLLHELLAAWKMEARIAEAEWEASGHPSAAGRYTTLDVCADALAAAMGGADPIPAAPCPECGAPCYADDDTYRFIRAARE